MPLLSKKEVLNLKLSSIPLKSGYLKELALNLGIKEQGSKTDLIKEILKISSEENIEERIDIFIKQKYLERINQRRSIITDEELIQELNKVKTFSWGVVQGQLDQKIQTEYVRKFVRYDELLENVKNNLHKDVTNYVICTWFNHWTTVLIEEHISSHPKVVPTLQNIKGIDIFFDNQPFDLKITYLPRNYDPEKALQDPQKLAIWMYENQGAQRFGADNRIYVVLLDKENPEKSWELKRNFALVFEKIDKFFNEESVSEKDEIVFSYKRKSYTALTKVLIITH
jgi:hypothetical protein